jgi:hypothetical protein
LSEFCVKLRLTFNGAGWVRLSGGSDVFNDSTKCLLNRSIRVAKVHTQQFTIGNVFRWLTALIMAMFLHIINGCGNVLLAGTNKALDGLQARNWRGDAIISGTPRPSFK